METQIIFFSSDISCLAPVIEGFITLLAPLKYPYNHITILPKENFGILQAPSPYIVGINSKYDKNFALENDLDLDNPKIPVVFLAVDLDTKLIFLNSTHLNKITSDKEKEKYLLEDFPDLPCHYKSKLTNKLNDYIREIKSNSKKEEREAFIKQIRYFFFQFMVSILLEYNKYLNLEFYTNSNIGSPSIKTLFNTEDFYKAVSHNDKPFYQKFVGERQMFSDFVYKTLVPKNEEEMLEILFFRENIMEKNSRKLFAKKVFENVFIIG